jgi:hypothetical protein
MRTHCTGAVDPPGTTWHDRPAVSRGSTLTVATDQSAAPGLLAEVGIAAAQLALQQLGEPPGQPGPVTTIGPFPPGRRPDQRRITATLGNVGQSDHGHAGNEGR